MKNTLYILLIFNSFLLPAQEKEKEKAATASNNYTYEANKELTENNFVEAEANYRKAISKNAENAKAKYNLGNAYYKENNLSEAFLRYKQAGEIALTKEQKHEAYHNMGNVFMKNKEYQKAVDSYKEALRNNPFDEETRYNLALAKEMLKKQQDEQKQNDQNKDDKDKDKDQDNKDQQDQNKDKDDKGENKKDDEGDDKKEENKDQGDNKEDDKKDEKGDEKEDKKKDAGDEKQDENAQQPRPNQMSPQQVKNMLKAIEDEEKKVQEKVNAQKVKGSKVNTEKDW